MQSFDQDGTTVKTNTYHVSKTLFWIILSLLIACLVVTTVLTIYFGINSNKKSPVFVGDRSTTTTSTPNYTTTTTIAPSPPVERIPMSLKPELYDWTITPDFIKETFKGKTLHSKTYCS